MPLNTDTTCDIHHGDPNFPHAGKRLAWRYRGRVEWSQLYEPTDEAKNWDRAPADAMAVGSVHGVFAYVTVRVTGRTLQWVPQTGRDTLGTKARVTFDHGTEHEETLDAWIVEP